MSPRAARPAMVPQRRDHDRYEIINEHGRGGLGRVSRAHDRELGRDIAIKELISRGPLGEVRFLREALITARLEHPGIVPVYEAGRWSDGTPFYAMKLVSGRPLRNLITERTTVEERIGLLHHVIAVADAIAYAHGRRIIHRDLKPANIIVGEFGETVVIDWGLAKDLSVTDEPATGGGPFRDHRDEGLTSTGAVLGTPAYMPPEQARGEAVDQRADVFAIGAMLWELCSLHKLPPSFAGQRRHLLRTAGIDPDLIAIIEKAADPDPARRYADAGALAADLKAFKAGARIAARSYSLFGMLAHWTRRHRVVAVSVTAAVIAAVGASLFYVHSVAAERDRADTALQRVEATNHDLADERASVIQQRNTLILAQATAALDADPTRAIEWLKTYPLDGADWDRVQVIAADAHSRGVARHLLPTMAQAMSISPDGKTLLTAGPHDLAQQWDLATGNRLHALASGGEILAAAIAADGKRVAIGDRGGDVALWTPSRGARTLLGKLDGGALYVVFSPDSRFVIASSLHTITAWETTSHNRSWSMPSEQAISFLEVAPVGDAFAFGTVDGTLHVSDFARARTHQWRSPGGPIQVIAFSADGQWIATGSVDQSVRLWNTATGTARTLGKHDGLVREIRFSPTDPALVASAGTDHKVRLWNAARGEQRVFSGHTDVVSGIMFSPDGGALASVSADRQVRLWDVASGEDRTFLGHRGDLGNVRFSQEASVFVSSGYDEQTRVWCSTPPPSRVLGRHENEAAQAVFSPNGRFVASTGSDRTARLWEVASGLELPLAGATYTARELRTGAMFSASGDRLVSVADDTAHVWDLASGEARSFSAAALLRKAAISPDGRVLAAADSDGGIHLWEVESNRVTTVPGHRGEVTSLLFLPSGDRVVSGAIDGTIRIWDVSSTPITGQLLGTYGAAITQLAVSPSGEIVASGSRDGMIHLWDVATHTGRALAGHAGGISGLEFSSNGQRLASSSMDATVRVWNVATGQAVVLRGHDEAVRAVAFAPRGNVVASGGDDRTVRLWNLDDSSMAVLRGHRSIVRSVAFDTTGQHLVTSSLDTTIRLWDVGRIAWMPHDRRELRSQLDAETTAVLPRSTP